MRQYQLHLDDATSSTPDDADATAILDGLNAAQQEAVRATEGPVLIIAGPGSGKTRALTHRIAYLLATGKAQPYQVLALTFTNKAAREMRDRVERQVGEQAARMWMGTFHATFSRLLRIEADHLGFSADFSIYDTDDSDRLIRVQMERFNVDTRQFSPRAIRSLISSAKNRMVSPSEYASLATSLIQQKAAVIYPPYQEALRRANAMDFDDLLIKPIELFSRHPEVLEKYQNRWRYIHIDEYQDTNHAQYRLANMLAARHQNICVVGDDAQSIYAFRGADITNILSFQRDYPDATTVRLEQNYRSTKRIIQLASAVIKNNAEQLEKTLWTENGEGDYVVLLEALSEKDEAHKVERAIRDQHVRGGHRWSDFAVLYRTNAQSRSLEEALRRDGIPYRVIGGVSFYQRREIKDVLAYLRLVVNPNDTASLRRAINNPPRGIGDKTQQQLFGYARAHDLSIWQAIERLDDVGLSSRAHGAVERFRSLMAPYIHDAAVRPADELAADLIRATGLLDELRKDQTPENLMRWENVQELLSAIAEYMETHGDEATLSAFLQEVSLYTDLDEADGDENRVTLMTLHASKGLEFPVVFICGLEEGLFPLAMAAKEAADLAEERRLFYVGVTRAEQRLFLAYARSRFRYGQHEAASRSRFVDEIDVDVVRTETGGALNAKTDRFKPDPTGAVTYDEVDPHYYRRNLRTVTREKPTRAANGERRVVYDEGEADVVPGARVEHSRFGEGKVLSMDGTGDMRKAVVFFEDVGQKKLVLKYAGLKVIG